MQTDTVPGALQLIFCGVIFCLIKYIIYRSSASLHQVTVAFVTVTLMNRYYLRDTTAPQTLTCTLPNESALHCL